MGRVKEGFIDNWNFFYEMMIVGLCYETDHHEEIGEHGEQPVAGSLSQFVRPLGKQSVAFSD